MRGYGANSGRIAWSVYQPRRRVVHHVAVQRCAGVRGRSLPSGRHRARSGTGCRDVALGLIIIGFALARKPGATGAALLITSIVPIGDFVIAGKALGYAAAARHLIALPFLVILGLVLVRK